MKRRVLTGLLSFSLCVISLFILVNCSDFIFDSEIKFNQSINEQIENDTTVTVTFVSDNPAVTGDYYTSRKKYKIGSGITAENLPNSNTDKEMSSWKSGKVIKAWKVYKDGGLTISTNGDEVESFLASANGIILYPEWRDECVLTLMDGVKEGSTGKAYSGNTPNVIKFWAGEKVRIPTPGAQFNASDNTVVFENWYSDSSLSSSCNFLDTDSEGLYWQTESSTTHTTIYAGWKYKYVYVDPQSAQDDSPTGIDRNHPVKTIAEAKKYLKNAIYNASNPDEVPAIKLMSVVSDSSDFSSLSGITTSDFNNAILTRWSGYTGSFIDATTSGPTISLTTFDGGSTLGLNSSAPAICSNQNLTLTDVTIQNFHNTSTDVEKAASAVYCSGYVTISGCTFKNNSSGNTSPYGSSLYLTGNGKIENTDISNAAGYSVYAGSDVQILNDSNIKNAYVKGSKSLTIGDGVKFDTSKSVYLESGASIKIVESLSDTLVAKIESQDYTNAPFVLTVDGSVSLTDNYKRFACAHSGYGINSLGQIVPSGDISITISNPGGVEEFDLGNLSQTQVSLNTSSDTVVRFILNSGVIDNLATWGLVPGGAEAHPIQYMIDGTAYGCVQAKQDSATGNWYADIVIGRQDNKIPNEFEQSSSWSDYELNLGMRSLQIYSAGKDSSKVVTKKNYTIIVK
ncbi:MAG: hypothetical protein IK002_08005 [Treponema sp.]|uniref:hypothetical protein n=1 Tax=Treponema sp. TaxID=166 RepID=UPI00298E9991|nr:hypothetical protein [Treponema sp.]MBR5933911.1 hypothetical protein [Treponema sp.]